jgi:hypothetical protein
VDDNPNKTLVGAASYNLRAQSPMFDFAQIRDGKFQATIYRESEGEVGFPAAPDMLEQDIKGGDRGMRIGKLQLIMEGESGTDFSALRPCRFVLIVCVFQTSGLCEAFSKARDFR